MMLKLPVSLLLLSGVPLVAGPPLICHPVEIGAAESLPWRAEARGWDGTDPRYDTKRLVADTLKLLAPSAAVKVRMETLRRAAIYASRNESLAYELSSRLMARTLDGEAAGRSTAQAWFDAGYYVETLRQATFIHRYDMLSPKERERWKMRDDGRNVDGYEWVLRAQRLSGAAGAEMNDALARITEYRRPGPAAGKVAQARPAPK